MPTGNGMASTRQPVLAMAVAPLPAAKLSSNGEMAWPERHGR